MKKIALAGIMILSPIAGLMADGNEAQDGPKIIKIQPQEVCQESSCLHEHRLNFGFVNLGYERIKTDSIYTALDVKMASILYADQKKTKPLDYFINAELRLGYNHGLSDKDIVTGYLGTGFSVFSIENNVDKIKNWNYGTIGVKYLHQFGYTFEMGVHIKGFISISQKQKVLVPAKPPTTTRSLAATGEAIVTFANDGEEETTKLVSVKDTRWMTEISMPLIWHVGETKNWEIQFEPYYSQIPNVKRTHILGSRLAFGFRF